MRILFVLLCCQLLGIGSRAVSFDVRFLDFDDKVLGAGSISFTPDPGDGITLFSLAGAKFKFDLGKYGVFDEGDVTAADGILISALPGQGRRLQFIGDTPPTAATIGGALELFNGVERLSFEPSRLGGNLQLYIGSTQDGDPTVIGVYRAQTRALPEGGGTLLLLAISAPVLAAVSRRPRRA